MHLLVVSTTALPLSPPLLSGYEALDTFCLASFQEYDEGKYSQR